MHHTGREKRPVLGGLFVDIDTQYTRDRYEEIVEREPCPQVRLTAWRNDRALSQLVLFTGDRPLEHVRLRAEDLNGEDGAVLDHSHVELTFLKSTLAYIGYPGYGNRNPPPPVTPDNRAESVDILYESAADGCAMEANSLRPVWLSVSVPKETKAGTYSGIIFAEADGLAKPLRFTCTLTVEDAVLWDGEEFKHHFDIELWQYPYSVAEYYGVEPFSPEHFEILRPHMELYKKLGGHAITATILEDAWDGQTFSKNPVAYPSMARWTLENGEMHYDFSALARWVAFNRSLGLGDKVILYSVAPWHESFTYWSEGKLVRQSFQGQVGGEVYTRMWRHFFAALADHLTEQGWFDAAYIGIDERGLTQEALDVIFSVRNRAGKRFKTASAVNDFEGHWEQALQINDVTVSNHCVPGHEEAFLRFVEERRARGHRTTLYTCTEDKPGNFCLSAPVESYWSVMDAGRYTAGMLRWAYDAWVEDPLRDATHSAFEPGDCFLVYPGERSDRRPRPSVRLERMAQAVRDVNKLRVMTEEYPELSCKVNKLYRALKFKAQAVKFGQILNGEERRQVTEDVRIFQAGLEALTREYLALRK